MEVPAGIPETFEEHIKLMFDLQVLAYQADLTRVITFMVGRELSNRTYPAIEINEAHHSLSHHQNNAEKLAKLVKINTLPHHEAGRFPREAAGDARRRRASLLDQHDARLRKRPERRQPARSLAAANHRRRRRRRADQGRPHLASPKDTPMTNLLLTVWNVGVRTENSATAPRRSICDRRPCTDY